MGLVNVWHPAKNKAEVIIPITVVIFILLSFFYSIPFLNDTNDIYFSFRIRLKIVGLNIYFMVLFLIYQYVGDEVCPWCEALIVK